MKNEPVSVTASKNKILYVEDDFQAREILEMMLKQRYPDQQFFTADNGSRGLARYRELRPAIVITDISMPEMDGVSMAAEIKKIAPETIIIALTAHSETERLLRAIETGINHYLLKPLDFERFCTVLDNSIAAASREQQLREQHQQIRDLNDQLTRKTGELENINIELEAFNYSVAHDLRSPLVSIGGFSQLLLERYSGILGEQGNEYLQTICKEILHMNSLIEALLNFANCSRKSISRQQTALSRIAEEILGILKLQEPERRVTTFIAADVVVFADPSLARIVLENLINNAWKFTSQQEEAVIEFGKMAINGTQTCFVRDNGPGFDMAQADMLFTPFQRLPGQKIKGHGIGLATVQRIIKRHGGEIWAESAPGKGAVFYFTLPEV